MLTSVVREFKQTLLSTTTPILLIAAAVLTYIGGAEFASRGGVTAEAALLGITTVNQEWAHRVAQAALGIPLLMVTVAMWYHGSKSNRHRFSDFIFVKPLSTARIVVIRLVGIVCAALVAYLAGLVLGIILTGIAGDLWPDPRILFQSVLLNITPGLTAWLILTLTITSIFPDLKSWLFPTAILWLLLTNMPATSMFWFYREINNPLYPICDPAVWLRVGYSISVAAASFWVLLIWTKRQRNGLTNMFVSGSRSMRFKVMPNPTWANLRFALKITLGRKLVLAFFGASGLAFLLAGPFGPMYHHPAYVRTYFSLAFSELLFPLFGLMAIGSVPTMGYANHAADIILCRPGGEGKLLYQKLIGLTTYFCSTCAVYSFWLSLWVPLPFVYGFGILFPGMLLLSGLVVGVVAFTGSHLLAYGCGLGYWLAAYFLEDRFPWFLSPLYHLAEYAHKMQQDLLWVNKSLLLLMAAVLLTVGLLKTLRSPVRQHG